MDPGPYNPDIGSFAAWYQDTHGRTLDLCLSKAVSSRAVGPPYGLDVCESRAPPR